VDCRGVGLHGGAPVTNDWDELTTIRKLPRRRRWLSVLAAVACVAIWTTGVVIAVDWLVIR
jgi:hypothetical protein